LFNPELYLLAYGRIYRNEGALTPGVTAETVNGMRLAKIRLSRSRQSMWSAASARASGLASLAALIAIAAIACRRPSLVVSAGLGVIAVLCIDLVLF
jgi:hypothetical protein